MTNKTNLKPENVLDYYGSLVFFVNSLIKNVNTVEVVKVVSVNKDENEKYDGTLNVIPIVKRVNAEGVAVEESVIYGVRYFGWQFGDCAIEALPKEDDIGFIVVSKRDITSIESGRVASNREYCLADGIYIGGIVGFNQTPKNYIKFTQEGVEITSEKDLTINAKKDVSVNAEKQVIVNAKKEINITSEQEVNVTAPSINLGGSAGSGVARFGDTVTVGGVNGTITSASSIVKAV